MNSPSGQLQQQTSDIRPRNPFLSEFAVQIIITVAVFLLGFLGLQRLGQFDTVILKERELAGDERRDFRSEINTRLEEIRSTTKTVSEEYVAKAVEQRQKEVLKGVDELEEKTKARIKEIENKLEPYRWLESRSNEVDSLVGIDSIGTAEDKVTELFQDDKPDMAIRVAEHALDTQISGSPDDFHNLAAELGRQELYSLASRVVQRGLEYFPQNVDLLSSGIKYLSSNGDIDAADKLTEKLEGVPKGHWNWRAFVFLGDYLELVGRFDAAFTLYEEFKKQLPHEERAYSQHGGVFKKWGNYDKAIEIFEEGLRKTRKAPQTALLLAESYIEVGEYAKAIAAAGRAIEGTADAQPSANIAASFWTRAIAKDALIHANEITEQAELAEYIGSAIADYQAAMSMPDRLDVYMLRGPQRIQALQLYARSHGIVDADDNKAEALLDLLQQLGGNQKDGERGGESR
uniref:Tetratricopeptide repeat-containing protein n=1 Tax=Candidatus Kentrum sp. MB TaxID=2138164 RepID=A0A451BF40_9GAMM|nr:MAG: Tetratricopeptide repeat-containing protein [Candidatus Kentron sp. MB]VFK76897.1 MAG: Tetratricopeptide repeat-containing protein [Candidatus Kentron sp. MB]